MQPVGQPAAEPVGQRVASHVCEVLAADDRYIRRCDVSALLLNEFCDMHASASVHDVIDNNYLHCDDVTHESVRKSLRTVGDKIASLAAGQIVGCIAARHQIVHFHLNC